MANKYFIVIIFCFIIPNVYAEYLFPDVSKFIIERISEEAKKDLELVEYHMNQVDDKNPSDNRDSKNRNDGYFQEYTLYNNGNMPHKVRLGVVYQYDTQIPSELFRINGVKTPHQLGTLVYNFAFIDVVFPPQKKTLIRINDLSYTWGYDEEEERWIYFTFNGTPRFTATIGNYYLDYERRYFKIERNWINDIEFYNPESRIKYSIISMLEEKDSLSNDLFDIRKINGNTWEIEFTRKFVDEHCSHLAFRINSGLWGITYIYRGEVFNFSAEKELTPYQYLFLTNNQLQVVRNAYYARHGYIFKNQDMGKMMRESLDAPDFGNINYKENPNFKESMLTDIDRANIEIIKRLEALAEN